MLNKMLRVSLLLSLLVVALASCNDDRPPFANQPMVDEDGNVIFSVPPFADFAESCEPAPEIMGTCLSDGDCDSGGMPTR